MSLPLCSPRALSRALVAVAALLLYAASNAHAADPKRANFDARPAGAEPPAAQERALERLRGRLGPYGAVALDERTGTLRSVGRLDGYLTEPSGRDGAEIALSYVRDHAAAFGLDGDDLRGLQLTRRTFVDGVEHLTWQQRHDGISIADGGLQAAVTGAGRLLGITGPPAPDPAVRSTEPSVSAAAAYAAARRAGGAAPAAVGETERDPGVERHTRFDDGGQASLTLFHSGDQLRLGWRVLAPISSAAVYDVLVDAQSGEAVRRVNRVKSLDAKVFEISPAAGPQVDRSLVPWLGSDSGKLSGPNAYAFSDVGDEVPILPGTTATWNLTPAAGSDVAQSDVADMLQTVPHHSGDGCPGTNPTPPTTACTWNPTVPSSWAVNRNQSVTQLFYLVNRFADFLAAPPINFTSVSGGFRRTGQPVGDPTKPINPNASDPVFAQALDGADDGGSGLPDSDHVNNASFLALPDGLPGFLSVVLWRPSSGLYGAYDGANDASLVFHEYAHGLSERLVTDSDGYGALNEAQSAAIGEGTSDFYSLDYLAQQTPSLDGPGADVRLARYFDAGDPDGVRYQPIDCVPVVPPGPADAGCVDRGTSAAPFKRLGGLTYADFGHVYTAPEPHADGEIWAQTLWAIRAALIDEYDDPALGMVRARRYITGAMRAGLLPNEPSFLDMRNAILQVSVEDDDVLWRVFAERGMGFFAQAANGADTTPVTDFTDPATLTATATTGIAVAVGVSSATLTGSVRPYGAPTDAVFEYGTTTAYERGAVPAGSVDGGSAPVPVSKVIAGLQPSTTYHFRLVAARNGRRHVGSDATFRTAPVVTPTPTPTPTPEPKTVTTSIVSKRLTADRRGMFKVKWTFGDAAPAGKAKLRVLGKRRKRIASATIAVRPGRTITKTLRLTRAGRRMIKPGHSLRVTVELRLPNGGALHERMRLKRKR